jgi:NAD(P)H-hydrate epimerase
MSFITGAAMRSLEEAAFRSGISAESLMDLAGEGIARRLISQFPQAGLAIAYVGKGNNGGDALVALRHLRDAGWRIRVRAAWPEVEWATLPRRKLRELGELPANDIESAPGPCLQLDGLLGIGGRGPLREPLAALAAEMARLRAERGALIAAMDLPSGMDADSGEGEAVTADLTLTVGVPKRGLASAAGIARAGRILLVPVAGLPLPDRGSPRFFCPEGFPGLLPPRPHAFHKGDAGRLGLLAGSPGMTGAAVLCAEAALRAGAGLVTLHAGRDFLPNLAASMPAEVMVRVSDDPVADAFAAGHDALVIGPGTGKAPAAWHRALRTHLAAGRLPGVLDADALNQLAAAGRLDLLGPHHLITPHPGEFRRLAPDLADIDRLHAASDFVARHPCTLLLKGERSLVAAPGHELRFNPTGHAGMASGGQGDVLAGVAGALLAGGRSGPDAAALAAWLCGRAAERTLADGPFTRAGDTLRQLGGAWRDWQECRR